MHNNVCVFLKVSSLCLILKYLASAFNWKNWNWLTAPLSDKYLTGMFPQLEMFPLTWMRRGSKRLPFLKSITHIPQWWNLVVMPYLKKIQKIHRSRNIPLKSVSFQDFDLSPNWRSLNMLNYKFKTIRIFTHRNLQQLKIKYPKPLS